MKLKNTAVVENSTDSGIKVMVKYDQPQYLFAELPQQYRNLMEFDIALIKEHFAKKGCNGQESVYLHEPYFESSAAAKS